MSEKELEIHIGTIYLLIGMFGHISMAACFDDDKDEMREAVDEMHEHMESKQTLRLMKKSGFDKESIKHACDFLEGFKEAIED